MRRYLAAVMRVVLLLALLGGVGAWRQGTVCVSLSCPEACACRALAFGHGEDLCPAHRHGRSHMEHGCAADPVSPSRKPLSIFAGGVWSCSHFFFPLREIYSKQIVPMRRMASDDEPRRRPMLC